MNERDMIIKYGTFYIGLSDDTFYWEVIIINLRKILLSGIIVSLSS